MLLYSQLVTPELPIHLCESNDETKENVDEPCNLSFISLIDVVQAGAARVASTIRERFRLGKSPA